MTSSESEEEEASGTRGRPNRWWAEQKGSGFSGAFRGVPIPQPGHQSVHAEDLIGGYDTCWCGEPMDHDWPGKNQGRKHPKEKKDVTAVAADTPTITRQELRAYNDELAQIVIDCVNGYGVRYRKTNATVILYPKDGTQPLTIGARSNGGNDIQKARKWMVRHVIPGVGSPLVKDAELLVEDYEKKHRVAEALAEQEKVEEVDVAKLAEVLNGPEHPVEKKTPMKVVEDLQVPETTGEWVPHLRSKDGAETGFATDGTLFKCLQCEAEGKEYVSDSVTSIGGHKRTRHSMDTESLWGEEASVKKIDTRRFNILSTQVREVAELLFDAVGIDVGGDPKEVERLEKEVKVLQGKLALVEEEREAALKSLQDYEAKMALLKETFSL